MGCDAARCVIWIFNKFEYLDKEQLEILSKKSYYDLSDTMQLQSRKCWAKFRVILVMTNCVLVSDNENWLGT